MDDCVNVRHRPGKSLLDTPEITYQRIAGHDITEQMLREASALFNGNYGIWSEAAKGFATPGLHLDTSISGHR